MYDQLIEFFQQFKAAIPQIINQAIAEREQQILEINRDQLYDHGIDAFGNAIWPAYVPYTVEMKIFRNQFGDPDHVYEPLDHVALIQNGNFYAQFYIVYRDNEVVIWSKDAKTGELTQKYGRQIFGIAPDNWQEFLNLVIPIIERGIEMKLSKFNK